MKFNDSFWRWFGDSKVVDSNGDPLMLYHGTNTKNDFNQFEMPTYASESPEYASQFGGSEKGGRALPVYLKVLNPIDLTEFKEIKLRHEYFEEILESAGCRVTPKVGAAIKMTYAGEVWAFVQTIALYTDKNFFLKNGFDGIIQIEGGQRAWLIFNKYQIKSAIGNDGTWDIDDGDIRSNPRRRR